MGAEMLRQNGYSTAFFGKDHNVADWETSVSGPFDRWPTSQGFDHFYGFIGGESNQWQPALYEDTRPVELEVPPGREGNYTLNEALADRAIEYIHRQKSVTPDRPFFIYYAPGATHAPHHVPKEWIDKFKSQFDQGWDKYREECFARQLKLGVIPQDTKLTPRPDEIPAYDSLTPDQKTVAARLMETFAGYTAQTDHEVGRLLDTLEEIGQVDNTLVIWMIGDNGASMEGGLQGAFNEMVTLTGLSEDPKTLISKLDEIGGPSAYNHYPVGWAWAMNTPFQWGKQIASHFGGTRNPMVVSWPARITDAGGVRTQFHHVHRHRADHPGGGGRARTGVRERRRAEAYRRRQHALHVSTMPRRMEPGARSTSRCSATAPSTTTGGWQPASTDGCRGGPARSISSTTPGSSTTSTTISANTQTWLPRSPRS